MKKKSILIYNQYYKPLSNPPAKRLSGFAEYLVTQGWDVTVVTGLPNYPDGKILKGYKVFYKHEKIEGVNVYRFYELPLRNAGLFKRLVNYTSFALISLLSLPLILKCDQILISSPPLISAAPYFYFCKVVRKKVILDIRDLWPETIEEVLGTKSGVFYKVMEVVSHHMYKNADVVLTTGHSMKKALEKLGVLRINAITNSAKIPKKSHPKEKKTSEEMINIVYTGIMTPAQGIKSYLEANTNKKVHDKTYWHLAGEGESRAELENYVKAQGMTNVKFYGYISKTNCDQLIAESDLALVPIKNSDFLSLMLPNKYIEYLSLSMAVVSNTSQEIKNDIEKYDVGYFLIKIKKDFEDLILNLDKKLLREKSENAYKLFTKKYEFNKVMENFLKAVS